MQILPVLLHIFSLLKSDKSPLHRTFLLTTYNFELYWYDEFDYLLKDPVLFCDCLNMYLCYFILEHIYISRWVGKSDRFPFGLSQLHGLIRFYILSYILKISPNNCYSYSAFICCSNYYFALSYRPTITWTQHITLHLIILLLFSEILNRLWTLYPQPLWRFVFLMVLSKLDRKLYLTYYK